MDKLKAWYKRLDKVQRALIWFISIPTLILYLLLMIDAIVSIFKGHIVSTIVFMAIFNLFTGSILYKLYDEFIA